MGTVVSCSVASWRLSEGVRVDLVESSLFEQYKIGEGDAVPGLRLSAYWVNMRD